MEFEKDGLAEHEEDGALLGETGEGEPSREEGVGKAEDERVAVVDRVRDDLEEVEGKLEGEGVGAEVPVPFSVRVLPRPSPPPINEGLGSGVEEVVGEWDKEGLEDKENKEGVEDPDPAVVPLRVGSKVRVLVEEVEMEVEAVGDPELDPMALPLRAPEKEGDTVDVREALTETLGRAVCTPVREARKGEAEGV